MTTGNLSIWNTVERTDPAHTKNFSRGGGFKGTAISPIYLAQKATEVFGPAGIGWGMEVADEQMLEGAPLLDANGAVIAYEKIHCLRVKLWYKFGDEIGEVQQYGQTTFIGKNKFGFFTDEEAPKKSLTDAMTKCLSLLGFSADVHLGRFDDNKYIAENKRYFADQLAAKVESMNAARNKTRPNPTRVQQTRSADELELVKQVKTQVETGIASIEEIVEFAEAFVGNINEDFRADALARLNAKLGQAAA